ncbi:helix-turn-helix domain-containing protein [Actinoallomurus soli]|uniref:helix-turn-helix domain-containing protein n=1 Tax=Actinoallomurus soli TaxID=2952535 RepID=UPI002091FECA|nr:AraC family transcriptional regulator [Actinoallomurus soli]MCO5966833.1 AraC family transcriptional regulator [Actinoallomurus soli]
MSLYREFAPEEPHAFVRCWWEQSVGERVDGYVQRVLPDACADVIVSADGSAIVVGPATEHVLPRLRGGQRLRGLRIRTAAIGTVLGLPASELRDLQVPLGEVFPAAEAGRITDAVWHGRPWPAAVDRPADRRAEYAVGRLLRTGARVADVAGEVGLSERHVRRLILARTGLEPRTLRRVARLQRFLTLSDRVPMPLGRLRTPADPVRTRTGQVRAQAESVRAPADRLRTRTDPEWSLAGLAVAAGYADQAHLSREVRALAGLTPSALLAERGRLTARSPQGRDHHQFSRYWPLEICGQENPCSAPI